MDALMLQTSTLKILAVLLVLASASERFRLKKGAAVITFLLIPAPIIIYWYSEGINGMLFSIYGLSVAFLCGFPFLLSKKVTFAELSISLTVGGIVGPLGSLLIFLIVFTIYIVQYILGSDTTTVNDHLLNHTFNFDTVFSAEDKKSPLARIEAKKILLAECRNYSGMGSAAINLNNGIPSIHYFIKHQTLTWGAKLALATLSILITGFFI